MAENWSEIKNLADEVSRILINFRKDSKTRKTLEYKNKRINKLTSLNEKFKTLQSGGGNDDFISAECERFNRFYKEIFELLSDYTPSEPQGAISRAKSLESVNFLEVPETLDQVKAKFYGSKNELDQLNRNISQLTEDLAKEFDLDRTEQIGINFGSEAEKLEFVIEKIFEAKVNKENNNQKELNGLKIIIQNLEKNILHLKERIDISERDDDNKIKDYDEKDRINSVKFREFDKTIKYLNAIIVEKESDIENY